MTSQSAAPVREARLEQALKEVFGDQPVTYRPAATPVASPIRRAVDHECLIADSAGRTAFVTVLFPELADLIDTAAVATAARSAHAAGVAPAVLGTAEHGGVVVYDLLPETHQWARTHQLRQPDILTAVAAAKRAFHASPPLPHDRDVFADIADLRALVLATDIALPQDFDWMLHQIGCAEGALKAAGRDTLPCHRDSAPSNVMLAPDGTVQLVDFDIAGNADPHHDIGALLAEVSQLDDEWHTAVEVIDGRCDEQLLARYRLNAAADDLAWGLWGLLVAARRAGQGIEYFKYGQWRLLRCRYALHDRRFEMWTRKV